VQNFVLLLSSFWHHFWLSRINVDSGCAHSPSQTRLRSLTRMTPYPLCHKKGHKKRAVFNRLC